MHSLIFEGIHGRPYTPYDGVQATTGNQNNGYCNHVSILFPTWHRPYLALFEQVLYGFIQQIAAQYPQGPTRDNFVAAAKNFRIPYWDWAASPPSGQSVLPTSVGGSSTVLIDGPNGSQLIGNPLFSYLFDPLNTTDLPDPPVSFYCFQQRSVVLGQSHQQCYLPSYPDCKSSIPVPRTFF